MTSLEDRKKWLKRAEIIREFNRLGEKRKPPPPQEKKTNVAKVDKSTQVAMPKKKRVVQIYMRNPGESIMGPEGDMTLAKIFAMRYGGKVQTKRLYSARRSDMARMRDRVYRQRKRAQEALG
jgi:hypothetical protein